MTLEAVQLFAALTAETAVRKCGYGFAHNERWAEVHERDNRAGMDTAFIQQKLLQPSTNAKDVSGMGIGAYQARTYIRALGGDISITSEPGQRAHFVIRLPLQTLEPT